MKKEENISFSVPKSVFYNPQMHFCRSFASLAVGAIGQDIEVCDAFCASGIRGIRYAKENPNVKGITFIDIDKAAITAAKKNARTNLLQICPNWKSNRISNKKANKIKSANFIHGNISRVVFDICADFLEIDPFGSPAPYIYDSFRVFNPLKEAYLSVTATDVAVLCGARIKACMKNYHARPLNNEFTHETGLRIMIKKVAEVAAEFNMGITPLVSISKQHYLKSIIKVTRGAEAADRSLNSLGYINYCRECGWRSSSRFPVAGLQCPECKSTLDYAGQLWLGEIHQENVLDGMLKLNKARDLEHRIELEKTLQRMKNEVAMPPYYYNLHKMCKLSECKNVPKIDYVIERLREKGHKAGRTHFSETSIKTDAPFNEIEQVIVSKR